MDNFRYIGAGYKTKSEKAKPLLDWFDGSVQHLTGFKFRGLILAQRQQRTINTSILPFNMTVVS